jgi:CubicO group peptidase (beta-lactamase class C family)
MPNTTTQSKLPGGVTPAQGYTKDNKGNRVPAAAGGDLYSTANDMVTWIKASLNPGTFVANSNLSQGIAMTQQTWYISPRPHETNMGLAWQLDKNGKGTIWKNGAAGGFTAWLGLIPSQALGIAMLTNYRDASPDAFAGSLLKQLAQ